MTRRLPTVIKGASTSVDKPIIEENVAINTADRPLKIKQTTCQFSFLRAERSAKSANSNTHPAKNKWVDSSCAIPKDGSSKTASGSPRQWTRQTAEVKIPSESYKLFSRFFVIMSGTKSLIVIILETVFIFNIFDFLHVFLLSARIKENL